MEIRIGTADPTTDDFHLVRCRFPANSGSGTVPSAILSSLPPTASEGLFAAFVYSEDVATAGGWSALMSAGTNVTSEVTPSGQAIVQNVAVQ